MDDASNYWVGSSPSESQNYLFRLLAETNGVGGEGFQQQEYGFGQQSFMCSSNNSSSCNNYFSYDDYHHQISAAAGGGSSVITAGEDSTTTATPQDRAYAALQNHKEAEKRRRERINSHLHKLRALLPCNSKTDKASLLAKVVERLKELKQQTSEIAGLETFPSESDEITVLSAAGHHDGYGRGGGGQMVFQASVCCEDRTDLLPELIEIFKSLHLKTVRAEMVTLGGRTRNVLMVAPADGEGGGGGGCSVESIHFLKNALKSLLDRSSNGGPGDRSKRRRVARNEF
ncbi:unnamed protein product [Linum tenue]|uniref:BHLH domain-containing protein n=1 Tax=Linum tenue TaxID=586396 RepID=A0AAV0GPA5_9ROSI|nr:unnamed protein product [Linum tenue]